MVAGGSKGSGTGKFLRNMPSPAIREVHFQSSSGFIDWVGGQTETILTDYRTGPALAAGKFTSNLPL